MAPFLDTQLEALFILYHDRERDPQLLYGGSQDNIVEELKTWLVRRKEVFMEQRELKDQSQLRIEKMLSSEVKAPDPGHLDSILERRMRGMNLDEEATADSARATYLLDTLKSRGVTWPELWWRPDVDGGVCSFLGTVDEDFDAHATLTELEAEGIEERIRADRTKIDRHVPAKWAAVEANLGKNLSAEDKREIVDAIRGEGSDAGGGQPSGSPGNDSGGPAGPGERAAVVRKAEDKMWRVLAGDFAGADSGNGQAEGSRRNPSRQEKRAEARKEIKAKAKGSKKTQG